MYNTDSLWERENMARSTLTCQKNNVTPGNNFETRKSICKRTQKTDLECRIFSFSFCVQRLHKIVLLRVYVSRRIHTPLMATTASITERRQMFISISEQTAEGAYTLELTHGILESL